MKLFAYAVREFDEKPLFDKWCAKLGVEFAYSTEYPTPENIELARGYDAISTTPTLWDRRPSAASTSWG